MIYVICAPRQSLAPEAELEFVVELKIDGPLFLCSMKMAYWSGATRGDGEVGEDITHNLRTIKSIPYACVSR